MMRRGGECGAGETDRLLIDNENIEF
jgi:hypothetical protein